VIAAGGIWFNRQQRERELEIARGQREQELGIAERRTQDEALQAYLDQMSEMLIPNKDQPSLYRARPGDSLSSVARARTLTVLPRLDGERKGRVVQFLYESGLISSANPLLDLGGADLSEADLSEANLSGADLAGAWLFDMDTFSIGNTLVRQSTENEANLWRADLSEADLSRPDLRSRADLQSEATIWQSLLWGWADKQLRAARSLEGASMPDGQTLKGDKTPNGPTFEDWLKDKRAHGEDGENE
jgi:hypothetical protein